MKLARPTRKNRQLACFYASMLGPLSFSALHADVIVKDNNTTALNNPASWVGGVSPTDKDIAVFDSLAVSSSLSVPVGGNVAFKGIRVQGNTGGLTITGALTETIGLGASGLDFSGAGSGTFIDIDSPVIVVSPGSGAYFRAGAGVSSTIWGGLTMANAAVAVDYSGSNTGSFYAEGFGSVGGFMSSVTVDTDTGMNFATINAGDRKIVRADALGVANPSDGGDAAVAATLTGFRDEGYVDVTNSNGLATATAFLLSNVNHFPVNSGLRFGQPHTTADTDWVVSFGVTSGTNNSRIQPNTPFAILVTPEVGARDVIFQNSTSGHEFRYNGSGTRLVFQQHNTAGDLIWRGDISKATNAANSNATSIVKAGPGRLILANASYVNGAGNAPIVITEGTLQLGEGGTSGTLDNAPIINNGALVFNKSNDLVQNGAISGSGTVTFNTVGSASVALGGAGTYTGATTINGGTVVLNNAAALGVSPAITIAGGGGLRYGTGVNTDLSTQAALTFTGTGAVSINTNGNDVTYANTFGGGASTSLAKLGAGMLTLGSANSYTGGTTLSGGGLRVTNSSGSATGSGSVTMALGTTLSGAGRIEGAVQTTVGATLAPGNNGVGNLTVGSLSLVAGSIVNLEFSSTSSYDRIVTLASGGLTVNGGGVNLYNTGGTSAWFTPGNYNLIQHVGSIAGAGPSALSILNPQAGYSYTFGSSGGFLTLNVMQDAILSTWSPTGAGSWGNPGNWTAGVPTSGYTALFTTDLASPATITLDGNRTINGVVFDSPQAYTLAQGTSGALTLDKGVKDVAVNITQGTHVISAPLVLSSTAAVSTDANTGLTISGAVSGSGGIRKTGAGFLNLTSANSFAGAVDILGGTVEFSQATGLGTGALTINGGTLRYNAGNTADISSKTISVGQDGATIDTGGNDVIWLEPIGNGGPGSFTKTGAGILALSGDSTYLGNTTVTGGTVLIDSNAGLGPVAAGSGLTLNGGTLGSSQTLALDNAGANHRAVTLGTSGGTFNVASGTTLTVSGVISGAGSLTKSGAGTLALTGSTSGATGAVTVNGGTITSALVANLPSGAITLNNDAGLIFNSNTAQTVSNVTVNGTNSIVASVPGQTASTIFGFGTIVAGTGTLTVSNRFVGDFTGSWAGFNGKIVLAEGANASGGFRFNGNTGSTSVELDLGTRGISVRSGATGIALGALSGSAGSVLTGSGGGVTQAVTYTIGGRNSDTTFSGVISNGAGLTSLTKVGTGSLTLTGANTYGGLTTINGGTLRVDGSIAASTATVVAPATPVMVNAGGILAGSGTISAATSVLVDGALRPDASGMNLAKLTFDAPLSLAGVTQFDFSGASFTGVRSTASGSVTYGGALKFNFLGTVFNGTYQVFDLASASAGAFTGVSVTTLSSSLPPVSTETGLTDVGSGVWSGTDGTRTYSFNSATGVLSVSGSAAGSPITPAAATLTANPGNGVVGLSWSAASGANTYLVKRSTTAGTGYVTLATAANGTSYNDTTATNGVTYYYVVQGRNTASSLVGPSSNEVSATPTDAPSHTALETWRFQQFGVYTDDGTVLAGDLEDYDGDGLVNLQEYAFGTNPKVANASPVVVGRNGDKLSLTYPRIVDAKLTYTVQGRNDLTTGSWATVDVKTGNAAGSTVVEDTVLLSANPRRFLRLSVTYTP